VAVYPFRSHPWSPMEKNKGTLVRVAGQLECFSFVKFWSRCRWVKEVAGYICPLVRFLFPEAVRARRSGGSPAGAKFLVPFDWFFVPGLTHRPTSRVDYYFRVLFFFFWSAPRRLVFFVFLTLVTPVSERPSCFKGGFFYFHMWVSVFFQTSFLMR